MRAAPYLKQKGFATRGDVALSCSSHAVEVPPPVSESQTESRERRDRVGSRAFKMVGFFRMFVPESMLHQRRARARLASAAGRGTVWSLRSPLRGRGPVRSR